jgi:signal transduction histidine kinase/CheY-like chemotaxis protein
VRLNEARDRGLAEYEGACRRKDGTAFTGQTLIRRLAVDGEASGGFVAVTCDVTERRMLAERLRHSEKLEAVGVLAGGVAHDFNNLLAAIIGYAGLIQMNLDKADPNQQHVEEIQVVAERAAGLTEQLLAFSRRQALKTAVVDLSALVEELLPILRSLVGGQVEVVHEAGSVWPITADPSQIDRVLVNLATNARDAMPAGGTLTIRTSNVMLDGTAGGEVTPGHFVLLEVTDTGVGMDEATRARIFEPFFSTREMGRGLGLAAVYGIVRQMQGTISVESRPGKGATFRLYFPRGDAQRDQDIPSAAADGPGALLLVEDDAAVRSYLCQLLEREGFRVLAADHRASALQLVAGSNEPLALIITDVMMPDGGGPALVEDVERIRPGVPALYISGHLDAANASGMPTPAHFLQKPFSSDELLTRVRRILTSPS